MRQKLKIGLWEYICVYVDDLCLAMKDPKTFIDKLKAPPKDGGNGYQIKGDGPLTFHLGCDYIRDKDGTLRAEPKKYIAKMLEKLRAHVWEATQTLQFSYGKGRPPRVGCI